MVRVIHDFGEKKEAAPHAEMGRERLDQGSDDGDVHGQSGGWGTGLCGGEKRG